MIGIMSQILIAMFGPAVNTRPGYDQTDNTSGGKRAASGLILTDLALWSLTGLKLFLVGENPLSGDGEVRPRVRIVPSPCSYSA